MGSPFNLWQPCPEKKKDNIALEPFDCKVINPSVYVKSTDKSSSRFRRRKKSRLGGGLELNSWTWTYRKNFMEYKGFIIIVLFYLYGFDLRLFEITTVCDLRSQLRSKVVWLEASYFTSLCLICPMERTTVLVSRVVVRIEGIIRHKEKQCLGYWTRLVRVT